MIVGVSMMRDEADICGTTVAHLISEGVERLLILDNGSRDDTRKILEQFPQVSVHDDPERGYYQSRKMSALAEDARCLGATWIVPFDADEMWFGIDRLKKIEAPAVWASTYEHPPITAPLSPWRAKDPKPHRKVAFRATAGAVVAQGNHDVSIPGERVEALQIREFQYRTFNQFCRKVRNGKAAYDATDLPEGEGAHWRRYGAMTTSALEAEWAAMTQRADVVYDPC